MRVLTILFAVLLTGIVYGQSGLSGRIVNSETQEGVPSALVVIKGTFQGAYTDQNGQFEFSKIKGWDTLILGISHLSYQAREVAILPSQLQNGDVIVNLSPSTVLADEVIVSATRAGNNISTTYTEVDAEEIEKQNLGQDIPYLLNLEPSIVTTSDAGTGIGYTGMRIRGSDQSRINVTVNGIPYNDAESQGVYFVDMPDFASSVDNIQVQRGVGTSTNGAGAFGGTVNIKTTALKPEAYGEISSSYGSFNTWKNTVKLGTGLLNKKFTFDGRLSSITSDGYIDRATADLQSYYLSGGYYGKHTILRANVFSGKERTYQAWWGTPEYLLETDRTYNYYNYPNEVDDYRQDHYQLLFSQEAGKNWLINAALHYTRGYGYYEQYRGPEYNNDFGFNGKEAFADYGVPDMEIGGSLITETSLIRRRWLDNHFYGGTFSFAYSKSRLKAILGGGWNQYDGDHYGKVIWAEYAANLPQGYRYYDNNGLKTDFNIYGKLSYQFTEKFSGWADLQYRTVTHIIGGIDNDQRLLSENVALSFINPKLGLSYDLNSNNRFYASYAIGQREPTRSDFIDAPAGETPKPEAMGNLEVGYQLKQSIYAISANYYLMNYKDQLVLTGELNDVGSPVRTNVDNSYRTGIELAGTLNLWDAVRWDANFTFSSNKIKSFDEVLYVYDDFYNLVDTQVVNYTNTDISYSPSIIAGSALSLTAVKNFELSLLTKYVGTQYLDNTSSEERKIDAYFVNDIRINYELKNKLLKKLAFYVLINNVLNEMYSSNGYTFGEVYESFGERARADYNYYYPQAGTNVLGGITIGF